jgi:hypothetical protein
VPAENTLHTRIDKPERPDRVQLVEDLKPHNRKLVLGWERPLDYNLRRVKRDDKTVVWDVIFRVRRADRHYYLDIWALWKRVPGTHTHYGDSGRSFHVKTP